PSVVDHGNALGCDNEGNVYMSGDFASIANFGKGQVLHAGFSAYYYFLTKLNSEGEVQWTQKLATRKTGQRSSDLFVDERGQSILLHNGRYFKVNNKGEVIQKMNLKAPGGRNPRIARIVVDGQGTLFTMGLSDSKKYFLNRTDRRGQSLTVWQQKTSQKDPSHLPVLSTNEEGKLFVAGITNGKPPSKQDVGNQAGFITSFGLPDPERESAPLALCPGQSQVLQVKIPLDLPFFWMKDGAAIAGATDTLLTITEGGTYQVKTFVGNCEKFSNIQEVGDCNKQLTSKPRPPQVPVSKPPKEAVAQPQPEPEPTPVIPKEKEVEKEKVPKRGTSTQGRMTVATQKIKLYVWDHGSMDNDTISVIVNGKTVLKRYCLTRRPKAITIKLKLGQNNRIELYAHNLGAIPPNTASIRVDDGTREQVVQLRSNLKKSGSLNIRVSGS
ncbi:MAG: hypothetical protein AB8F95_10550, partial [Bacteroidia bacterium]